MDSKGRIASKINSDDDSQGQNTLPAKDSQHTSARAPWPLHVSQQTIITLPMKRRRSDNSSGYAPSSSSLSRETDYSTSDSGAFSSDLYDELDESILKAQNYTTAYDSRSGFADLSSDLIDSRQSSMENMKTGLLSIGTDPMANVLTFLDPSEILSVLTMPLCKEWRESYTSQQDLWRILCVMDPFNANVGDQGFDDDSSYDSDSFCSISECGSTVNNIFGKYRLMYTSFVRCMKYLKRMKEDTMNGTAPSSIDYGKNAFPQFGMSKGLTKFLSRKKSVLESGILSDEEVSSSPIGVSDEGFSIDEDGSIGRQLSIPSSSPSSSAPPSKKPKFGKSMITSRLLGPSKSGKPSHLYLPRSCGIYSLVNWMVAYPDVEGIQTMCVEALPCLLEDERQRMTAQRAGLIEVILQAMLRFDKSLKLHIAAFHAMVLLTRPLGGREGMLFDSSMAEASSNMALLNGTSPLSSSRDGVNAPGQKGRSKPNLFNNGIGIMMLSMRRFQDEEKLQAMACWAMVNLALVPEQKTMLISLGAIQTTLDTMKQHPSSFDVQFRAMFALINLLVPNKIPRPLKFQEPGSEFKTEKDVVDRYVGEITHLVVSAMKHFCSCETILNRACLVLHNISQSPDYMSTLLWTPHCYQMLEWSITNHATEQVLRRTAMSTLHRLEVLLSSSRSLRCRFANWITSKQCPVLADGNPISRRSSRGQS